MSILELLEDKIKNGKVSVVGFGVSNRPLIEILLTKGAKITVRDKAEREKLMPDIEIYENKGVNFILGENYLNNIDDDVIFRSPGVRPDKIQRKEGSILTSEMEYFFLKTKSDLFAITGSDGKTTTTTLTYKLLSEEFKDRKIYVGGNIGTPLLSKSDEMNNGDISVLELSSFQLFTMTKSPKRALITNITPNHLDWHKDMNEYIDAKCNIFRHEGIEELTLNFDNDITKNLIVDKKIVLTCFSTLHSKEEIFNSTKADYAITLENENIVLSDRKVSNKIIDINKIKIPGMHNVQNYMSAISMTRGLVTNKTIEKIATTFNGVEHRLEFVREFDGVKYYNSSIDSSPTRTIAALSALKQKPIIICGGYDKHIPFEVLGDALCQKVKSVILTGDTAKQIEFAIKQSKFYDKNLKIINIDDFDDAVHKAKEIAKNGDIVLLSPACASFDKFKNFMERGNHFKNLVNNF